MRLWSILFCFVFFPVAAFADDTAEVHQLLKSKIDAVVVLLQDNTLEKTQRNQKITDIVTPLFDYSVMSKLSLGKKHWGSLSKSQQQTFSALFTKRLQDSYLEKLDLYSDEKVVYGEAQQKGRKVQQPTTLISKDNQIEMLYKLYRPALQWQIYDVEIAGVSVVQTYRSQFDGVLKEGTIDDLLKMLGDADAFVISTEKRAAAGSGNQ
ncbi:MAG: ABC transporter substrate-binding protein [Desulfuromonadales bacterium]|nr:ABC transporter substrate-binding protein [Desulfuromonadales bacterium]